MKKPKKMSMKMGKPKQHGQQKGPPPLMQAPRNMLTGGRIKKGRTRS